MIKSGLADSSSQRLGSSNWFESGRAGMDVSVILKPLLKWWWLVVAATAIAAVSSFFAVRQQPVTYRSATTLMIGQGIADPNPSGTDFYLSQQLAQTYVDIAQRQTVRERTMEALGLNWLPSIYVRQVPNSQLIEISVVDTSPERAQIVANELANQLILQSPTAPRPEEQERESFIKSQLSNLQENINQTAEEIAAKQDALREAISAREIAGLEEDIRALQSKETALQANYAALLANTRSGAVNTLTVIEQARFPTVPVGPARTTTVVTATVIGLALAAGAAFLLEYLDDTVKSPSDLKRISDLPILPAIPESGSVNGRAMPIAHTEPRSPAADAFRALRAGVLASCMNNLRQSLLVTSAKPIEGKSNVAANLAVVLAQGGHKVLLVDADLRRPVQDKLFGLEKTPGLTDILNLLDVAEDVFGLTNQGDTLDSHLRCSSNLPRSREDVFGLTNQGDTLDNQLEELIQPTKEPRLSILTSGSFSSEALKLLNSEILADVLSHLAKQYDCLIIDSPPVLAVSDALMLSTLVGSVLLVAEAGSVRRKELSETIERLRNVDANIIGLALNRLSPKSDGYYGRYRDYYETGPARADEYVEHTG
jgi:polysaccharide biosynthesis transport protein